MVTLDPPLLGGRHLVEAEALGPEDLAEARRLLQLAASQGEAGAQATLGGMCFNGQGGPQDWVEARRLYELAAAQGSAAAQFALGTMCRGGQGGPLDLVEAGRLYRLAAAQGHAGARAALDGLDRDAEAQQAKEAERRALRMLDRVDRVCEAKVRLDRNAEARRTKEQADAEAIMEQLLTEDDYEGGASEDFAEARRLFELAAARGNATAKLMLGNMHGKDQGGAQDLAEAERLVKLAAAQGHTSARRILDRFDIVCGARVRLDKDAEAQQAKKQADADAMMAQLLAEDAEEKNAKGATKSTKSAKGKKAKKKRGGSTPAATVCTDHGLEAIVAGIETAVEDNGDGAQVVLPIAPLLAAESTAAHPVAPEPTAPILQGDSQQIQDMLKGMLNIGGTPGAAAPPSGDAAWAAAQATDLRRGSLAQLGSRQQQLLQAAAALPTMSAEEQARVHSQLAALAQQLQACCPACPPHRMTAAGYHRTTPLLSHELPCTHHVLTMYLGHVLTRRSIGSCSRCSNRRSMRCRRRSPSHLRCRGQLARPTLALPHLLPRLSPRRLRRRRRPPP